MGRRRVLVRLGAAVVLAAFLGALARSQTEPIPVVEVSGFEGGGTFRPPGWVYYRIMLHTVGEPFQGRVVIDGGGLFASYVEMPPSSRKEVVIPVLCRSASLRPTLHLEDVDGTVYEESKTTLKRPTVLKAGDILAGLVESRVSNPEWLDPGRFLKRAYTATFEAGDIPERLDDLQRFDLFVLAGNPEIPLSSREAISSWLLEGGVLLLPGPDLFRGAARGENLRWLFPGFRQEEPLDPSAILSIWGRYDAETVFLHGLDVPPRKTFASPLGKGRIVLVERGRGAVVFLTAFPEPEAVQKAGEKGLQAFWQKIIREVLGFENRSPPNPRRLPADAFPEDSGLFQAFQATEWPLKRLRRAESLLLFFIGMAFLSILVSSLFFIQKRLHFLFAGVLCVVGTAMFLVAATPGKTASGEAVETVNLENGNPVAVHRKLLHIGAFAPCRVDCLFPDRTWRIEPAVFAWEEMHQVRAKWVFGPRTSPNALGIRGIRLTTGGRFLALVSRTRADWGRLTARWLSADRLVIKNEIRPPLTDAALFLKGRILPLGAFEFGDPPRRVDVSGEWVPLQTYLSRFDEERDLERRVFEAFLRESAGNEENPLFVAFAGQEGPRFDSEDVDIRRLETPLTYMRIPDRPLR